MPAWRRPRATRGSSRGGRTSRDRGSRGAWCESRRGRRRLSASRAAANRIEGSELVPAAEKPGPEGSATTQVASDEGEQGGDLGDGDKGEDVVGLGLSHELAEVVGTDFGIGIAPS